MLFFIFFIFCIFFGSIFAWADSQKNFNFQKCSNFRVFCTFFVLFFHFVSNADPFFAKYFFIFSLFSFFSRFLWFFCVFALKLWCRYTTKISKIIFFPFFFDFFGFFWKNAIKRHDFLAHVLHKKDKKSQNGRCRHFFGFFGGWLVKAAYFFQKISKIQKKRFFTLGGLDAALPMKRAKTREKKSAYHLG